ncbi:UNVERIFIED_CONTAM: hypothetical protein Slati_4275500 [Sesamum latifolium]|uniref:Uncharacterized protein n=1 Tax=Sesamum latifolium TaxID=2727402 RepID=A0AAW2TCJ3_9LAMI
MPAGSALARIPREKGLFLGGATTRVDKDPQLPLRVEVLRVVAIGRGSIVGSEQLSVRRFCYSPFPAFAHPPRKPRMILNFADEK